MAHLSDYTTWDQLSHAEGHVVFPENIGAYLTIDETSLSQGELYTVITNKAAGGKKGCLVAIIRGTDSDQVGSVLLRKIPLAKRREVKEVTLDM
ncbi:DDE transposase, partial [Limnospira fusiformis CCALA 023]